MLLTVHVISDLFLGYNEFADEEHVLPKVDLVVINGNIGNIKRCVLYAETLCKKYPNTKFILNFGEQELYSTVDKIDGNGIIQATIFRKNTSEFWPKNLYFSDEPMIIEFDNGRAIDVLCMYGFPKIHSYEGDWKAYTWYQNYPMLLDDIDWKDTEFKPKETSDVRHGFAIKFASMEWINERHEQETTKARNWENTVSNLTKVLITHINPFKDTRCTGQNTSPYLIHLNEGLWVSSNYKSDNIRFLGARLLSNPGRGIDARNQVADVTIY